MIYFTADTHFGHESTIRFGRPFKGIEEMDRTLIENWNAVVGHEDTIYILGDFWYKGKRPAEEYIKRLHGHKILIFGNHDHYWMHKQPEALRYFEAVELYMEVAEKKPAYNLCHYPMLEWNGDRRGRYLIHGHTHATPYLEKNDRLFNILKDIPNAINAGVDLNHFCPATLEQLIGNNNTFYCR